MHRLIDTQTDAYVGQNTCANRHFEHGPDRPPILACHSHDHVVSIRSKIRDTLNNLILKSPQNWQTSAGLPFFQIQGTVRLAAFEPLSPNSPAHTSRSDDVAMA